MKTIRNNNNDFATIVNNGNEGFTVHFGYTSPRNAAHVNDTVTDRKVYKTEKTAIRKANEYLGIN